MWRSTFAPTTRCGFVATIGPVSLWLKKEEAQDMVATLTRALLRSAALQAEEKPDLSPTAVVAALQALLRSYEPTPNIRKFLSDFVAVPWHFVTPRLRGWWYTAKVVLTVETTEPFARPSGPRYQPIAQIGRGGMAEVLLAMMDAGCGARRLVVLKRIWPELATDPDFMTMFLG